MKMKPILHVGCAALLLVSCGVVAEAADAVPTAAPSEHQDSSQGTRDLWEQVLSTLETHNHETSLDILKRFDGVKDAVPYQKTFAVYSLRLLAEAGKPTVVPQPPEVTANKSQIEVLRTKIEKEEEKKPLLDKQIADASKVGPIGRFVEWLTGLGDHGQVSEWGKTSAERDLKGVEKKIADDKAEIAALEKANVRLQQAAADKVAKEQAAFREKVVSFLREQMKARRSRPAIALATLWLGTKGADAEISTLSQAAVDMLKAEKDGISIAASAIQAAKDLVAKGRLWDARAELTKATEASSARTKDPLTLEFIQREVSPTASHIDGLMAKALKQRDLIMEIATRDGAEAAKKLEEFKKTFPDDPGYDQDKSKIYELRVQQVGTRFSKDLAAIEAMIPRDPTRARAMIPPLFTSNLDQDETAILKSLVAKVNLKIVQQETDLIRADLDLAQAFLSQFSATYAEKVKAGAKAQAGMMHMFTTGVENLVRARDLQEKSLQRLKLLLTEEMDAATKSPLMRMLEKETAALKQMDDTLAQHQRNKTVSIVLGCVLLLGMVGGGIFALWKRKKNKGIGGKAVAGSAPPPSTPSGPA